MIGGAIGDKSESSNFVLDSVVSRREIDLGTSLKIGCEPFANGQGNTTSQGQFQNQFQSQSQAGQGYAQTAQNNAGYGGGAAEDNDSSCDE